MSIPTTDDVNKVREQASNALGDAFEQARTPLLAALGAGDLAANALIDALNKVREQADTSYADPAELRKRIDAYSESAARLYGYLAERGEETLGKLRAQPEVQVVRERADEAQKVADDVLGTARPSRDGSKTQSSATQSAKTESTKTQSTKADSTKAESAKTTGAKSESAKADAAKGGTKARK